MSAILSPMRLCRNPIRARFFSGRFGSLLNRDVPSLTRVVSSPGLNQTRIASNSTSSSNPSVSSEKDAALAAASTSPDSPTM